MMLRMRKNNIHRYPILQDRSGRTALHWCCHHSHPACLKLLLPAVKKADPPLQWWADPDQGGVTLLHLSTRDPPSRCLQAVVKQAGGGIDVDVQVGEHLIELNF